MVTIAKSCLLLLAVSRLGLVLRTAEAFQHLIAAKRSRTLTDYFMQLQQSDPAEDGSREDAMSSKRLCAQRETLQSLGNANAGNRRLFFASALFGAGAAIGGIESASASEMKVEPDIRWERSPINKRSGVTVFDAEKAGYNLGFVTYLSRFLLNFDEKCQRWWFLQSKDLPRLASAKEINKIRLEQFGRFSASVEVGLQDYEGTDGPARLLQSLLKRYCPDDVDLTVPEGSNEAEEKRQKREIKEARRQLALLFGLLDSKSQPTAEITKLLAAVDNGSIYAVKMKSDAILGGYSPGYDPPLVQFPLPQAGEKYEVASGRAVLEPTGKILRVDFVDHGSGYDTTPKMTVSPPKAPEGKAAEIKAKLFQRGPNKGMLESIQVQNPGSGYTSDDDIQIEVSPPSASAESRPATLKAVLELQVTGIEMLSNGAGYAVEKPLKVYVDPPPATATVDVNDTLALQLPKSAVSDKREPLLVGNVFPRAEKDSYSEFRRTGDNLAVVQFEQDLSQKYGLALEEPKIVSGTTSGPGSSLPSRPFFGSASSSTQLLNLLPSGVGLEYDSKSRSYRLALGTKFKDEYPGWLQQSSSKPLDPAFGPRGRSPIERDMELGLATYLRFCLSGAICASGVHLALVPLDVVKTKLQTDPIKYISAGQSFKKIIKDEGPRTLFTGWVPTFLGNFLGGAVLYGLVELIRRSLIEAAGSNASSLEVPIILAAAGTASVVGACLICPFEAVRIRSVAQPNFAPGPAGVLTRLVKEEGPGSLVNAIPVFLTKNVPYAMAKFLVFDLSTEWMYRAVPTAHEDLSLSLAVTLIGGILGGISAAVVSNPADAVISEMKKAKSDVAPMEALDVMLDREGPSSLFKGLPVRMVFYSLVASLQFLVYDGVRFALGIGSDDLKLYLDVLGGALRENGGPI